MSVLSALLRRLRDIWRPSYEPSRHYMRGPGPAWTAKRGQPPGDGHDAIDRQT